MYLKELYIDGKFDTRGVWWTSQLCKMEQAVWSFDIEY